MAELDLLRTEEALTRALESRESATIVCYTPFGIVRGKIQRSSAASATQIGIKQADPVLRVHDAVVEHYSSHLPTGIYKVFYLRLKKVSGYSLSEE
jgi:hypothetical protein